MKNPFELNRRELADVLRGKFSKPELDALLKEETAMLRAAYAWSFSSNEDKLDAPYQWRKGKIERPLVSIAQEHDRLLFKGLLQMLDEQSRVCIDMCGPHCSRGRAG